MEIITVKDVYKSFKIYFDKGSTLKEKILFKNRNKHEVHQVLRGINISIKKGEVIGLIGENGCGKSTLLKLMTKIIYPDRGEINIKGKVSSLLELGAGFHPDMTGRENIYNNASIFGLTKEQIDARLDNIIDFSELGEYIDNPVRTYSSGMYMRLAFSVAINVDADILLIDEILAVGDTNFQQKCFDRLRKLKKEGVTIVIVSHDTSTIENFCTKAFWILNGEIKRSGKARDVINSYLNFMNEKIANDNIDEELSEKIEDTSSVEEIKETEVEKEEVKKESAKEVSYEDEPQNRWGSKSVEIVDAYIKDNNKNTKNLIYTNNDVSIFIKYKCNRKEDSGYVFGIRIIDSDGKVCYGTNTMNDGVEISDIKSEGVIEFKCDKLSLLRGLYFVDVAITDQSFKALDFSNGHFSFKVLSLEQAIGVMSLDHKWII